MNAHCWQRIQFAVLIPETVFSFSLQLLSNLGIVCKERSQVEEDAAEDEAKEADSNGLLAALSDFVD